MRPDGSRPRAKSLFRRLWTSSPLPHLCLDHQINSSAVMLRLVTTPKLAASGQLHRGEWKLHLPLHSRQRLFDQPLPGSYAVRAVLGVPYPVRHEVHISPLLTRVHTMLPNAVQRLPVLLGDLGHRTAELRRHATPTANSITPARLHSAQYRSNSRWYPAVSDLSITFSTPAGDGPALQSTLATAVARRYVAVPKLRMPINSASDQ